MKSQKKLNSLNETSYSKFPVETMINDQSNSNFIVGKKVI